ncbi:serine/threonine-protein kinase [Paenibacillus polymyxa]|uniref:serine/threonine-protein kinase n=1 Tax=Paenibacillus polymyxa TaxID=1406 RepID=UPI0025B72671|nr:serine/threonine-protein kinase [Paenibacillus polymyxa]MDN4080087.1 serine/threonine-protein kinase [Paenibacillus polymyxa]MDN4105091.1 serine/threonine-protein kinase [Paenibacillus polymyxa]MDN4115408.1 serine/threonine-protein kinase [Paenibacillus polymyxa]
MFESLFSIDSIALTDAFPDVVFDAKLGEGGQKIVFKAQTQSEGSVAFKIIKTNQQIERTIREIDAASSFSPPRFPQIYRYGDATVADIDVVFIVEQFIEGVSLRKLIDSGPMSEEEVLNIGLDLILGLTETAEKNLVHRDIKPENIIVNEYVGAVLLDFGIARHLDLNSLTQDVAIFGPMTPGYAAPEQINNEKRSISVRTDLFAWGILMYEMLSGYNPFTKSCRTASEAIIRTLKYEPELLQGCNSELSRIISWCMRKQSHRRPPSPNYVYELLKGVVL